MIAADEKLPNRTRCCKIMDHTPDVDRCKRSCAAIGWWNSYRYIRDHLLRYLRNAAICMVWLQPDRPDTLSTSVTEKTGCKAGRTGTKTAGTIATARQEQQRQEQLQEQQEQLQEQQKQQQQPQSNALA